MRALIVTPQFPLPVYSGGHTRLSNLVREMGRHHELYMVSLITPGQERFGGHLEGLAVPAETVVMRNNDSLTQRLSVAMRPSRWPAALGRARDRAAGRPDLVSRVNVPRFAKLLRRALRYDTFDIVQLEFTEAGRYLPLIRQFAPQARIVLDQIEVSHASHERRLETTPSARSGGLRREVERLRRFEQSLWKECDAVVTVSEAEGRIVAAHARPNTVWVVPNGVDTRLFSFVPRPAHALNLLFLGYFRHPENVAGLKFFCEHVWPLVRQRFPQLGLDVVGGDPPDDVLFYDAQHGIRVHGYVPDVRQIMDDCAGMVVPLSTGGRTRLRVLEAFASGLPVISTRQGCEGIEAQEGVHVLFAESPESFVDAIQCIVDFPDNAARIAREARRLVEQRYGWQAIAEALGAVWHNVGREAAPPRP